MRPRHGFNLMELLLVLMLGMLSFGLICGCADRGRGVSDSMDTRQNLKNVMTACRIAEVESNRLPGVYGKYGRPPAEGQPQRVATVFVHLLPYLENNEMFREGNFNKSPVRVLLSTLDPSILDNQIRYTSFAANLRVFSSHGASTPFNAPINDLSLCRDGSFSTEKIIDGAGNTVFFTTKYGVCNGTPNYFDQAPERGKKSGPFFGAANHENGGPPAQSIATGRNNMNMPAYQISPIVAGSGGDVCNDEAGVYGHSMGSGGLIVAMGDTATRHLSFTVSGTTWARAICPVDDNPLGADW